MKRYGWLISLALLGACGGGGGGDEGSAAPPGATAPLEWRATASSEWPHSAAAAAGLSEAQLDQAFKAGRELPGLYGLLLPRRGALVGEACFNGKGADDLLQLRSVTKTVMATLIGMAIAEGTIASVDQPIADYLAADDGALLADKPGLRISEWVEDDSLLRQQFLHQALPRSGGRPDPAHCGPGFFGYRALVDDPVKKAEDGRPHIDLAMHQHRQLLGPPAANLALEGSIVGRAWAAPDHGHIDEEQSLVAHDVGLGRQGVANRRRGQIEHGDYALLLQGGKPLGRGLARGKPAFIEAYQIWGWFDRAIGPARAGQAGCQQAGNQQGAAFGHGRLSTALPNV